MGTSHNDNLDKKRKDDDEDDEPISLTNLFRNDDDDDSNDERSYRTLEDVTISGHTYRLLLPPDVGTLFAHRVWSGSKLLATYLSENATVLIHNKYVVELGAGTALPSLTALRHGCAKCVITDYPHQDMLQSLRETLGYNWDCVAPSFHVHHDSGQEGGSSSSRVAVVGHEWGTDVQPVLDALTSLSTSDTDTHHSSNNNNNSHSANSDSSGDFETKTLPSSASLEKEEPIINPQDQHTSSYSRCRYFDLAILSECLWMHRTHTQLAKSIHNLVHPKTGMVVLTYAHHIPGKEKYDDAFFDLCFEQYGFVTQHVLTQSMEYMWNKEKTIDVYLKVMKRTR